jgi:BRCA1 C Terminus (BRCT) domain
MECWATGVVACATGLTRIQRQQLQQAVTSAGGRYMHKKCQKDRQSLTSRTQLAGMLDRFPITVFVDRYTPELSRQCTHLVTTLQHATAKRPSTKLALAVHNAPKWRTHVVDVTWALNCSAKGTHLPETEFLVPAISAAAAAEVTAHVMAAARTAADGKCQSTVVAQGSVSTCSTDMRLPLRSLHEQAALRRSMQPPSPRPPAAKVLCVCTTVSNRDL